MLKRNIIKEKIENMSAGRILYFIGEINKIQDILNRSVIPNNIGYVVSRYFIFIIIGITIFYILKNEGKDIGSLFLGIMLGWGISFLLLFTVGIIIGKGKLKSFAPLEMVTYLVDKQENLTRILLILRLPEDTL